MTAPAQRSHDRPAPTAHSLVAAFVRFVVCGGGVGLASSGVLVLLSGSMPMMVANALITVVSTVVATELHSRISFRSERRGWGVHLQSGLTVAVSYAFTTGALLVLHSVQSAPSALVEQSVYLSASALAGVGRFALLRVVVFARPITLTAAAAEAGAVDGIAAPGRLAMAA
ncbi:GtrA family protein [Streptomyces sp. B1I3]|uniref:GtrA family protein n=1 Tax=Streptomyces sp. B1I3 TaxID=3042264 RepID=UPI002783A83B|nr:GtrA family protein [Streptomyces sp. B1I3]MDQ0792838.1 putative flippase GtrA [Streptomyces sp. B1I3]